MDTAAQAPASTALVTMSGVNKWYGDMQALTDIDLQILRGRSRGRDRSVGFG